MFDWIRNAPPIGGTVNVVSRLLVHGIYNHKLVYRAVVEALGLYLYWV